MSRCLPALILCAVVTLLLLGCLRAFQPPRSGLEPAAGSALPPPTPAPIPEPGAGAERYRRSLEAENLGLRHHIAEDPGDADEARSRLLRNLWLIARIKEDRKRVLSTTSPASGGSAGIRPQP